MEALKAGSQHILIDTTLFLFVQGLTLFFVLGYPYAHDLTSGLFLPPLSLFLSDLNYLGKILYANIYFLMLHWFYYAFMESSRYQATLGKIALGLKTTNLDGQRISFWRATLRYFGKFLSVGLFLGGFLVALFNHRHQTLHDIIAGCTIRIARAD